MTHKKKMKLRVKATRKPSGRNRSGKSTRRSKKERYVTRSSKMWTSRSRASKTS